MATGHHFKIYMHDLGASVGQSLALSLVSVHESCLMTSAWQVAGPRSLAVAHVTAGGPTSDAPVPACSPCNDTLFPFRSPAS